MEIVINKCYGGFGLSDEAMKLYAKYAGKYIGVYKYHGAYNHRSIYITSKAYPKGTFITDVEIDDPSVVLMDNSELPRADSNLVKVIKELGSKANGEFARLKVVTIPEGVKWNIREYDGIEQVEEEHETWY